MGITLPPLADDLGTRIAMIHRQGSNYISRHLRDLDIGSGQHAYLLAISDLPGCSQEMLTRIFGVDKANTARAVKRLEEKAYIRREQDPEDARALKLFLTSNGEACVEPIRTALRAWNNLLLEGIPSKMRASVHELFAALAEAANQSIH